VGIQIFDLFCCRDLDLELTRWPSYTNLTHISSRCSENELPTWRSSKIIVLQTYIQTYRRHRNHAASRVASYENRLRIGQIYSQIFTGTFPWTMRCVAVLRLTWRLTFLWERVVAASRERETKMTAAFVVAETDRQHQQQQQQLQQLQQLSLGAIWHANGSGDRWPQCAEFISRCHGASALWYPRLVSGSKRIGAS